MNKMVVGIIGLGTIGTGVLNILQKKHNLLFARSGIEIDVKYICDIDKTRAKAFPYNFVTDYNKIIEDRDVDIVVELIGGIDVAYDIVRKAIKNGKNVVTANKALLSKFGPELFRLSQENNTSIGFEAAVGGGIPIIQSLSLGLISEDVKSIYGILNGTTNYILTKMYRDGEDYELALKSAQKLGFAEADPILDVSGMDTAHKLSILAMLSFNHYFSVDDIYVEGINSLSIMDINFAKEMGYNIKLLAVAKNKNGMVQLRVSPVLIDCDNELASVNYENNAVYINNDNTGPVMLVGKGAGAYPTGSAVISDFFRVFILTKRGLNLKLGKIVEYAQRKIKKIPIDEIKLKYYLRFITEERPGILSKISGVLGNNNISIARVIQMDKAKQVPIVIITHSAEERSLKKSIAEIDKMPFIKEKTKILRIEEL